MKKNIRKNIMMFLNSPNFFLGNIPSFASKPGLSLYWALVLQHEVKFWNFIEILGVANVYPH